MRLRRTPRQGSPSDATHDEKTLEGVAAEGESPVTEVWARLALRNREYCGSRESPWEAGTPTSQG